MGSTSNIDKDARNTMIGFMVGLLLGIALWIGLICWLTECSATPYEHNNPAISTKNNNQQMTNGQTHTGQI